MRNKQKSYPRSTAAADGVESSGTDVESPRNKAELLLRMADKVTTASGNRRRRAMSEFSNDLSDADYYYDTLDMDAFSPSRDNAETQGDGAVDDCDTKSFVTSDFESSVDSAMDQNNRKSREFFDPLLNASIASGMVEVQDGGESDESINSAPAWAPINGGGTKSPSSTDRRRRSSINETADLKLQLRRCQQALVSIQENASLRYDKLEMKFTDAQQRFHSQSRELASRTTTLNATLELQEKTEKEKKQLEADLKTAKVERNIVVAENRDLRQQMNKCSTCKSFLKDLKPYTIEDIKEKRNTWKIGGLVEKIKISTEAAIHMLDLENETVAVTPPSGKKRPIPKKKTLSTQSQHVFVSKRGGIQGQEGRSTHSYNPGVVQVSSSSSVASSHQSRYNLNSTIPEIQSEMDRELEKLKSQWKSSSAAKSNGAGKERSKPNTTKRVDTFLPSTASLNEEKLDKVDSFRSRNSRHCAESKPTKKLTGLDAFFAAATPLDEEVVDEDQSFWSKQRSVQKKSKKHTSGMKKRKQKMKSNLMSTQHVQVDADNDSPLVALTPEEKLRKLQRQSLLTSEISRRSSFREKLASTLTELEGELVSDPNMSNSKKADDENEIIFDYPTVSEQAKLTTVINEEDPLGFLEDSMSHWGQNEPAQIARV
eukprot:CAMPEP_0195290282 /NCGR_PEP_ID=MMETSP0707-20130614/6212_1 /TAXON_ID=33640 /ORGANISM="Asterionellopsis glacialis, Strain CCMP134" /LENGTH=654 /DNA_ID=CAMNT_0040350389 /DNA_START=25 /DNA_END=1989 /DNA_ORIENTATION=+